MKKLSILPALIVLVIGGVFAATQFLPPSSTDFPSMPTQPGTIGYILSLFGSDGTAQNTDRLGGVTASGYLQNNLCDPTKVWTGIDANGKAICGTRTPLLVGNFTEGSMSVKRGAANQRPLALNEDIQEGDILITDSSQTGTIQFAQDASYIRLDANTTVEIRTGTLGGNTVAEAILADGQLWGRIMTSTGVNLGGGGLVAGVRGTSVAIKKDPSTHKITFAIVDSTRLTDAVTIINQNTSSNSPSTLNRGQQITVDSGATTTPAPNTPGKTTLLAQSWVQKNTLSDIIYLGDVLEKNPSNIVRDEIIATLPTDTELNVIAPTADTTTKNDTTSSVNDAKDNTTDNRILIGASRSVECASQSKIYWKSLDGTGKNINDYCKDANLIGFYVDGTIQGGGTLYTPSESKDISQPLGAGWTGNMKGRNSRPLVVFNINTKSDFGASGYEKGFLINGKRELKNVKNKLEKNKNQQKNKAGTDTITKLQFAGVSSFEIREDAGTNTCDDDEAYWQSLENTNQDTCQDDNLVYMWSNNRLYSRSSDTINLVLYGYASLYNLPNSVNIAVDYIGGNDNERLLTLMNYKNTSGGDCGLTKSNGTSVICNKDTQSSPTLYLGKKSTGSAQFSGTINSLRITNSNTNN